MWIVLMRNVLDKLLRLLPSLNDAINASKLKYIEYFIASMFVIREVILLMEISLTKDINEYINK